MPFGIKKCVFMFMCIHIIYAYIFVCMMYTHTHIKYAHIHTLMFSSICENDGICSRACLGQIFVWLCEIGQAAVSEKLIEGLATSPTLRHDMCRNDFLLGFENKFPFIPLSQNCFTNGTYSLVLNYI